MALPITCPPLARALAERNYTDLTPVQNAVIEPAAAGRDLLVSARTGSGKTVAYGLAIAADLLGEAEALPRAGAPLGLVVAPTRELALQVQRELTWLYAQAGARVIACVGGMDPRREQRSLAEGAHIVVGTPGRLRDHLERRSLDATALKAVVLDEADEMLDLGFREDLEVILDATPENRRTLLFSATLPKGIAGLAQRYQRNALRLEVTTGGQGHADIEYRAIRVAPNEVEHAVVNMLRLLEPPTAIVFCNTRDSVRHLQATLLERGFSAVLLSGELGQHERNQALQALRDGRARVCVATDVAARGIDLPNLSLVIHADLPHDPEVLQHRSGRTGRAGRKGISALLVPPARRRRAEQLLAIANVKPVWSGPPTGDEIRRLDQERLVEDALLTEPPAEDEAEMARVLLERHSAETLAAALVRLYRAKLPVPEEVSDPGEGRGPRPASAAGPGVWFRVPIGRRENADPRRLLPMICRRGGITKAEVGAIRIAEGETRFEITQGAAARFSAAVARSAHGEAPIEPSSAPEREARPPGSRPRWQDRPDAAARPHRKGGAPHARDARPPRGGWTP